ncbi:MAG: SwmB domain-containing protein, partial [Clostridiales bacterium]|nr:SwmB domain-containing protein [Clostridiales bacterium]
AFKVIAFDMAGGYSAVSDGTITINTAAAPSLSAVAAAGSAASTTKVKATAGTGNTLAYRFSATRIASTPLVGTSMSPTSGSGSADTLYTYTSEADITGVDSTTKKYLEVYELNSSNKVVKFKLFTLTAANIKSPTITGVTSASTTTIVLATDKALNASYVPAASAFSVKKGTTSITVSNVAVSGSTVTLTVTGVSASDALTINYTKPTTNYLQDAAGNAVASKTGLTCTAS